MAKPIPTLAELSEKGLEIVLAYVEAARAEGHAEGYRQAEADMAAVWRHAYENSQMIARTPSYEKLAERRGEPERAERQRAILRERGIA